MNWILRTLIFLHLFVVLASSGFGQVDSLRSILDTASGENRWDALYELSWEYSYNLPDSGLWCARTLEMESREAQNLVYKAKANKALSICSHKNGDLDSAIIFINRAVRFAYLAGDTFGVASALTNGGNIFRDMGQYEAAMQNYMLGREVGIASNNEFLTIAAEINMANTYAAIDKYENSREILRETRKKAVTFGNPAVLATVNGLIGALYMKEDKDSAIYYLHKSMDKHEALGDFEEYVNVLNNVGVVYLNFEEPQKAYDIFIRYKSIQDSLGRTQDIPLANLNIGMALVHLGKADQGIPMIREAWRGSLEEKMYDNLPDIFENLSMAWEREGNADSAIFYSRMKQEIEDSLANVEVVKRIQELETKYLTENQGRKIAQLEHQNAIRSRRQLVLWIVAAGLFLLSLLAGGLLYLYIQQRQLRIRQKAADLEQRALRAQMNPHFIFNSLNSVQMLFMQEDFVRANEYLGDFGQLLRNILEHSSQKSISLGEELKTLRIYLAVEQMRLGEKLNFEIVVEEGLDLDEVGIPSLILQPFVENAIWHGIAPKEGPGSIRVEIREIDHDLLLCTITDDGVGLRASSKNRNKAHHSRGMQITRERLGQKGKISLNELTAPDGSPLGTRVELKIPIQL